MTEVVAAAHDAHIARDAASGDALRHDVAIGFGGGKFHVDGFLSGLHLRDEVGQSQVGVGTGHEARVMVLDEVVLHALGHAAKNADNQLRIALFLLSEGVQLGQSVVNLVFGILAHRTRVQKHGVGLVSRFARLVARHLHHRGNHLRISHVHLAAVGFDIEFFHDIL